MSPRQRVSRGAIDLIKRFEGYRQTAAQLPDGRWTIGHGHTLTARQGAQVSEDDAEALLIFDLIAVGQALDAAVFTPLGRNQRDALCAFTFNIGVDGFLQSSVLKRLNEGDLIRAACAMELWRKAMVGGERIVIDALVRRRAAEKLLFLTPDDGVWVAAPTPLLPPLLDTDAEDIVPAQAPVDVDPSLDGDALVRLRDGEPTPAPIAPEPQDEVEGAPLGAVTAAAEAVTARLSTLFAEPAELAAERRAESSPPAGPSTEITPAEDPVPFFLRAPEPQIEPQAQPERLIAGPPEASQAQMDADEPREGDLFGAPVHLSDDRAGDAVIAADGAELDPDQDAARRRADDIAFGFDPPIVQPLPEQPQGGALTLVALAALGLIFFGGGIFWATYARPIAGSAMLGPRLVGGLAGVAGVGFFVVAVYLLLDRLGRAAERNEL